MKRNFLMASCLAIAAAFSGCSELDEVFSINTSKTYEATVVATRDSVSEVMEDGLEILETRAVFYGGNTARYVTMWDKGDVVHVYKQDGTEVGTLEVNDNVNKDAEFKLKAVLSGSLTGDFTVGESLDLYLPSKARDYNPDVHQKGTINDLSSRFSYQTTTVQIDKIENGKITLKEADMTHRQAYLRFVLTDMEGNRLHPKQLIISADPVEGYTGRIVTSVDENGTEQYGDLVIENAEKDLGEYPGEMFVALLNESNNTKNVNYHLTVVDEDGVVYTGPSTTQVNSTDDRPFRGIPPTGKLTRVWRKLAMVEPDISLAPQMKMVEGTNRTRVPKVTVTSGETTTDISSACTFTYSSSNNGVASVDNNGKVIAHSTGNATITVNIAPYGVSRTYTVTVTESPTEYVDLGLSVNWATMNVGATSETGAGTYFAWGEVDGYTDENDFGKTYFGWGTYKWCNGDNTTLTKYVPEDKASSHGYNGFYDDKSILDPEDDAAKQNWGGNWSMPTKENWEELNNEDNCTWTWYDSGNTEFNGIPGYKITSKKAGYTDKYIFLPAAGYRRLDSYNEDGLGYYWATSLNLNNANSPRYAWRMRTHSTNRVGDDSRNIGFNVRAVCPKTNITLAPQMKVLQGAKKTRTPKVTVGSTDVTKQCTFTYSSSNYGVARVSPTGEVTGVTPGTATITVTSAAPYAATKTYTVTVTEPVAETADNYVDLGLPSGAKWAKMNVGATSETGAGTYFAFGEIDGYTDANDYTKTNFHWTTYKWCNGSNTTITKYVPEDKALSNGYNNFYDNKTTLEPEDDAAKQNWGGNWSIPTEADWIELRDNCTWEWENGTGNVLNTGGVKGYKVSKGDAYIFLPAAGDWLHEALENVNTYGYYWTSSLNLNNESYPRYAYRMRFNNNAGSGIRIGDDSRCLGFNVRAIVKTSN